MKLATQVKLDLAFEYIKVSYEALFSSYGRDLLTLIAVAGDLDFSEDITAHTDCLEAKVNLYTAAAISCNHIPA